MTRIRNLPSTSGTAGLGFAFVRDLERDYRVHGAELISKFRKNEPRNYLRLLLSIAPQNGNAEEHWLSEFSDEQLSILIQLVKEAMAEKAATIASPP